MIPSPKNRVKSFAEGMARPFIRISFIHAVHSSVEMKGEVVRTKKDDDFPDS